MDSIPLVLTNVTVKSKQEIIEQFREIVHRHRRRFLKRNLRPCPDNCQYADVSRRGVVGCHGCHSHNREVCLHERRFVPDMSKEELDLQFRQDLRDPEILARDYRDIMVLLWVLGEYDTDEVPEAVIATVEVHQPKDESEAGEST